MTKQTREKIEKYIKDANLILQKTEKTTEVMIVAQMIQTEEANEEIKKKIKEMNEN